MEEEKINPVTPPEPESSLPTGHPETASSPTPPTPAPAAAPQPQPQTTAPQTGTPQTGAPTKTLETDTKVFAAISYLSILFIIPWVVKKEHPYVAFHIKQGMGLFIAEVIVWFVVWLLEAFLSAVFTYHAAGLVVVIYRLAWVVFGIVSLIGIYYALSGKEKPLPYLDVITKNLKI